MAGQSNRCLSRTPTRLEPKSGAIGLNLAREPGSRLSWTRAGPIPTGPADRPGGLAATAEQTPRLLWFDRRGTGDLPSLAKRAGGQLNQFLRGR